MSAEDIGNAATQEIERPEASITEPAPLPETRAEPPARKAPSPKRGGIGEWFWRGRALREARSWLQALHPLERARLARAQVAAELADRALDPVDPLSAGSSVHLAISLYREAAYWGLLAQDSTRNAGDLRGAFDQTPSDYLIFAAASAPELQAVRAILVDKTFVQTAEDVREIQEREARIAQTFVHTLIRDKTRPATRVGQLLLQRWTRTVAASIVILGTAIAGTLVLSSAAETPDLAAGKPWRASSSLDNCRPAEHTCTNVRTDIFFHTVEEKNPWVEFDLGAPTRFSVVRIKNRSDCCPDRAIPLVIEVSNDREKWREVARRRETFSTWRAEFAPQTARYVRARALRRTLLHFDKLSVHAY